MANGIDPTKPKKFRYTLDIRGVLEEVLFNSPDGWIQTIIKYARSKTYGGLLRSLTLPTKFVYYGAYLLRKEVYTYGWQRANVNFLIEKLVPRNGTYNKLYLGKLDFGKFSDDQSTFTINATEKDINVYVDAFADQQYAIPLTEDALDIRLTPLVLTETAGFITEEPVSGSFLSAYFSALTIAYNQQNSINNSVQDVPYAHTLTPNFATDTHWFYIARADGNVLIDCVLDMTITVSALVTETVKVSIINSSGVEVLNLYSEVLHDDHGVNITRHVHVHNSVPVVTGERLFLFIPNNSDTTVLITTGQMDLSYQTLTDASFCKAWRASYVYDYLIQKMNGDNPVASTQSLLLAGQLKQYFTI